MRARRSFLILLVAVTAVFLIFRFTRRSIPADFGPAVALCPGPDWYGYTCASGSGFAYIDAAQDTGLYADDGIIPLALPFPFTFYGQTYTELNASSNGTLQFGRANPNFSNDCLSQQPAPGMGNMIAPYWDDLNLQFEGFLETVTVGAAPDRIFVVEWDDAPRLGENPDDRVTFEVQLFEGSNDIVFLYEDTATFEGHNGSSATIGLQSEEQGIALQFSCNQAAIADAGRIYFPHPAEPNPDVGEETTAVANPAIIVTAKGVTAELINALNNHGLAVLPQLQRDWRRQSPPRAAVWEWVDVTGNGRSELILLWYGGRQHPELAQLVILTANESDQYQLLLNETLSTRTQPVTEVNFAATADLTNDGRSDLLIQDDAGQVGMVTAVNGTPARLPLPQRCQGSLGVLDVNGDGRLDIVRDHCQTDGRVIVSWDNNAAAFRQIDMAEN